MTAQNSANKSVFYKFLPYYLNKVKYLRPQLIMSIIFSVLSYPAFMLIINILCPVERDLLELSQYISDPTPEQYEMNMALLDKRSLLYSLLIAEIIIGVLSLVGLFIFTFVTTFRSFRCLHNKSVVDMDMSLPINHNTRFFGDLAAGVHSEHSAALHRDTSGADTSAVRRPVGVRHPGRDPGDS